jgi:hypothetical protein
MLTTRLCLAWCGVSSHSTHAGDSAGGSGAPSSDRGRGDLCGRRKGPCRLRCCAATVVSHTPSACGAYVSSSMRCVARGMQQRCECQRRSPVCLGLAPDARELAVCGSRSRCCDADCLAVSIMVLCKFTQCARGRQRRWIRRAVDGSRSRGLVRATERAMPTEVFCSHSGVAHPISVWCICI